MGDFCGFYGGVVLLGFFVIFCVFCSFLFSKSTKNQPPFLFCLMTPLECTDVLTIGPLSYLSFQPVLHDWCNKGRGMYYHVGGMVHIKEPLLLIGKSSPCGGSGFPLSLSEWSFTIWLTPYNRK